MKYYTINQFAELINVFPGTLRNWDKNGKLKPIKLESGHRRYTDEHLMQIRKEVVNQNNRKTVIYCRESTKKQESSLNLQREKCKNFCITNGWTIDEIFEEYGSGLNYNKKELQRLISEICSGNIERVVIYYKDRLVRFGFELIENICKNFNTELIVIDNTESDKSKEQEFADDLISIIHYFSMKLYGKRSYKQKIANIEKEINLIKTDIS